MRQHSSPAAPLLSAQMFTDLLKEDWMLHMTLSHMFWYLIVYTQVWKQHMLPARACLFRAPHSLKHLIHYETKQTNKKITKEACKTCTKSHVVPHQAHMTASPSTNIIKLYFLPKLFCNLYHLNVR